MKTERLLAGVYQQQKLWEYTFTNKLNHSISITNIGGSLVKWLIPDKNGIFEDILLGPPKTIDFLDNPANFGCIIGRYGNRIRHGRFNLGGTLYQVSRNLNGHCLHGGFAGFGKKIWTIVEESNNLDKTTLVLHYSSPDLEEGFPGNLSVTVIFTFDESGKLTISYEAKTDKDTVINLTSHPYFNLNGQKNSDVLQHQLFIDAGYFLEVDNQVLPSGCKLPVSGTPFDFTHFKDLGTNIFDKNEQLKLANGYDHNFILNKPGDMSLPKAILKSSNGREMHFFTSEPGIQLYTGNWLDKVPGKNNLTYTKFGGVCLETQHFPDSPNQPSFPSTSLKCGEVFKSKTIYQPVC